MKNHNVYLYDEIVTEKYTDWDGVEHGFTPNDMSGALADAEEGDTVNILVNSPGGSVFAAVAMTSEIKRAKDRGVTVNAIVDGMAASAASFLIMACTDVCMYDGTMLMVHKPMSIAIGNANDFLKAAEDLEAIENGTCMPIYRSKLKADEEELKALIANETWLSAREAQRIFDLTIIDEHKDVKNVLTSSIVAKYGFRHTPESLLKTPEATREPKVTQSVPVDLSEYRERICAIGGTK